MSGIFESKPMRLLLGLILFMLFIVWDLARRSNAGRFGTMILYIGLAMGIVGFLLKVIITYLLERGGVTSPR